MTKEEWAAQPKTMGEGALRRINPARVTYLIEVYCAPRLFKFFYPHPAGAKLGAPVQPTYSLFSNT